MDFPIPYFSRLPRRCSFQPREHPSFYLSSVPLELWIFCVSLPRLKTQMLYPVPTLLLFPSNMYFSSSPLYMTPPLSSPPSAVSLSTRHTNRVMPSAPTATKLEKFSYRSFFPPLILVFSLYPDFFLVVVFWFFFYFLFKRDFV